MKKLILFLFIFSGFQFVVGQSISGQVLDENGLPLPGATVTNTVSQVIVAADLDGNFSITAADNDKLSFTFVGYKTSTQAAKNGMKVSMQLSSTELEQVVVVGFGTKKAGAITGSVAQIKASEITKTPAQSAIQAIQGKAAGVNIVTNDEPGANPTVIIRGLGTVLGGRTPLYIIDGLEATSLNGIAPGDIENIDILKDASSLAIYGQKGANGIIVVNTKKAKKNKLQVSYDGFVGRKFIQREVEMADAYRYVYYNNTALGSSTYFNFDQPYNTNWLDEITDTGETTSHQLSISGGSENVNMQFTATNYKEKGILNGTQFERTNLSSRNQFKILDGKVTIKQNLNLAITNNSPKPLSAFTNAYKQAPIVPVRFENGRWGVPLRDPATGQVAINGSDRFNNVGNPAAQLFYYNEQNKNLAVFGNISAELQITKDIKFTSNFGSTFNWAKGFTYTPSRDIWLSENPTQEIADYPASNPINTLQQRRYDDYNWNWDNFISYSKTIDKHTINATIGMNRSTTNNAESLSATRWNVPEQSNYWSLDLSDYNTEQPPGQVVQNRVETPVVSLAYFARADYEFDNKYLFSATVRREGNSRFQESNRWGVFPAVSAGWVLSNEAFFKQNKILQYIKIRGGYGEVGNANALTALNIPLFAANYNYSFGPDANIFPGNVQPYQIDPNLTWETMSEIDFGFDFRMFENRLSGTVDFYRRQNENVLLPVTLPSVISPDRVTLNTGTVLNQGAEISLKWDGKFNDEFSYTVSGNLSLNKNELQKVNNSFFSDLIGGSIDNGQWTKQVLVGEPLGSFYVFDVTGFNGDGEFTYSDERVAAGSYIPTHTYALSFALNYKNFDFSVDTYGVGGNKLYNGKKAQRFGGENVESAVLDDFWLPGDPNATNPRPFNNVPRSSTYYIEDGAFFRINNITLGYTFPKFFEKVSRVRVYATAVNPFVFTKFTGYSPELVGNNGGDPLGTAGIELNAYPTNRTFAIGLNVSL
ncbi:SusC/RagA family TonB-linked outer membrane protein [Flavobacterium sp.]|uniref:SusC/RagA family TonB-linked outer membrane protein n=1 Tax=Flavobacterium sp. TaxID=239 RepID=UPI002630746F|nr:SusC/RagA family TonB-linked outer membrane protein [Flavobacterium sp.]